MFCEQCGAKLPDDSRFCEQCGSPVLPIPTAAPASIPAPIVKQRTAAYPGWTFEIEPGRIEDFTLDSSAALLEGIRSGETPFLIATPPALIEGTRYMQFCSDDRGGLHAELCVARGRVGFEMYGLDGLSAHDASVMLGSYLQGALPRPPAGKSWEMI